MIDDTKLYFLLYKIQVENHVQRFLLFYINDKYLFSMIVFDVQIFSKNNNFLK